jgi:hypothetical protein
VVAVRHGGHDRGMCGVIASKCIGHQAPGFSPLTFE